MSWEDIDKTKIDQEAVDKANANRRQESSDLAKAYNRCFGSDDGQRVLQDLTARFIYNNDTPLNATNINYESAYHNGESGIVKYIINEIRKAEML